jgi:hypothetical protein
MARHVHCCLTYATTVTCWTQPKDHVAPLDVENMMSREQSRKESGSVSILTLLAFSLIAGVFLYVALLGGRTADTTRVRVAADSTAMAAATVKAKVLNLEAYVLLADTMLLPLAHVVDTIQVAQIAGAIACAASGPKLWVYCATKYAKHIADTNKNQPKVKRTVDDWLDGLDSMADALRTVGPVWAEVAAHRAGVSEGFSGAGSGSVSGAVAFPFPGSKDSPCSDLGIDLMSSEESTSDGNSQRDACHDQRYMEEIYMAVTLLKDPKAYAYDMAGWILTFRSLWLGIPCSKEIKVPKLADDWKEHSISYGMTLSENPSDQNILPIMDRMMLKNRGKDEKERSKSELHSLVRFACAEHYSQDHYSKEPSENKESLWHMDWRARLIPCDFGNRDRVKAISQCGVSTSIASVEVTPDQIVKIQAQFASQLASRASTYWKF